MNIIKLILSSILLTTVIGCTEAQKDDTFAIVCGSVPVADSAFQIYASSGKVRASVIDTERAAVASAQAICDGPRPADTRSYIAAVQRALTAIANATAQARAQVVS
jgi:hypothetical protein